MKKILFTIALALFTGSVMAQTPEEKAAAKAESERIAREEAEKAEAERVAQAEAKKAEDEAKAKAIAEIKALAESL